MTPSKRDHLAGVLMSMATPGLALPPDVLAHFVDGIDSDALVDWLVDVASYEQDHVLSMYDRLAKGYEAAFPERRHVEESLSLLPDGTGLVDRALDVGCGTGRSTKALCRYAREMTGLDGSAEMLRLAAACVPHANLICADFTQPWPFPAEHFDLLLSVGATRHLPAEREALFFGECVRVLRRGGRAILTFVSPKTGIEMDIDALLTGFFTARGIVDRRFRPHNTVPMLQAAGLAIERETYVNTRGLYDKWLVLARRE